MEGEAPRVEDEVLGFMLGGRAMCGGAGEIKWFGWPWG